LLCEVTTYNLRTLAAALIATKYQQSLMSWTVKGKKANIFCRGFSATKYVLPNITPMCVIFNRANGRLIEVSLILALKGFIRSGTS
jgi:hypothetical protein